MFIQFNLIFFIFLFLICSSSGVLANEINDASTDKANMIQQQILAMEEEYKKKNKKQPTQPAKAGDRSPASYRPPSIKQQIKKNENIKTEETVVSPEIDNNKEPLASTAEEEEERSLLGDWGGLKSNLSEKGISIALINKTDIGHVFNGGVEEKTTTFGTVDLRADLDGEKLLGVKGLSFFTYFLTTYGGTTPANFTDYVGDFQATSNIDAYRNNFKLFQAYAQYTFLDDKVSILAGVHDLNSEFYVTESSSLFLNGSFGVGAELSQTGINGSAVYPNTAPALRLRVEPSDKYYFQAALFSGHSGNIDRPQGTHYCLKSDDGLMMITEFARTHENKIGGLSKLAFGAWAYSKTYDHLTKTVTDSNGNTVAEKATSYGAYTLFERPIVKDFFGFIRYGYANSETNAFSSNLAAGFNLIGLVPWFKKDQLGLAYTRANTGKEYRDQQFAENGTQLTGSEEVYELTYRFRLMDGVDIQPDLQYVIHPSGDPHIDDAVVGILRLEASF